MGHQKTFDLRLRLQAVKSQFPESYLIFCSLPRFSLFGRLFSLFGPRLLFSPSLCFKCFGLPGGYCRCGLCGWVL
jgi:hypothetical protein